MGNETKFKALVFSILIGTATAAAAFGYAVAPEAKEFAAFGAAAVATLLAIVWMESRFCIVTDDVEIRAIRAVRKDLERKVAAQASGRRRSDGHNKRAIQEVKKFMACRSVGGD